MDTTRRTSPQRPDALPIHLQIEELVIRDIAAGRLVDGQAGEPHDGIAEMLADFHDVAVRRDRDRLEPLDRLTCELRAVDQQPHLGVDVQRAHVEVRRADEHAASSLTRSLDKPMRNASDNERSFAAILELLQNLRNRGR